MGPARHERIRRIEVVAQLVGVQVPLADVPRLVARLRQHVPQASLVRVHPQLVNHHPRPAGVLAGKQRRPVRRADRHVRDRLPEVDPVRRQSIQTRRPRLLIARISAGLVPQLVRQQVDDVGPLRCPALRSETRTARQRPQPHTRPPRSYQKLPSIHPTPPNRLFAPTQLTPSTSPPPNAPRSPATPRPPIAPRPA